MSPDEVGPEMQIATSIEGRDGAFTEFTLRQAQLIPQRYRHELLKDSVHIHEEPLRTYSTSVGLKRTVPQDKAT